MHHWPVRASAVRCFCLLSAACLLGVLPDGVPEARAQTTGSIEAEAAVPVGNPDEAVRTARQLISDGKPADAEQILLELNRTNPDNPAVLGALAEAIHEQNRTVEAVRLYERVVALDPEGLEARLRLADFYIWTEQPDSALEHYMVAQKSRPNDPALLQKIAQLLLAMDRTEESIPYLEGTLSALPGDAATMKSLYEAYLWTDRPTKALGLLEQMVEQRPGDIRLARELAERYLDGEEEAKARAVYERILETHPEDTESLHALGQLYEWDDRPRAALKQYERYLEFKPFDSEVRARALSLSMDLGFGRRAKSHAGILGAADPRFDDLARRALLVDPSIGSAIGTEYIWFSEVQGFNHHAWRIWGAVGINEYVTLGAFYRFHWFLGPDDLQNASTSPDQDIYGHQPGLFGTFKLPGQWTLGWNMSVLKYHEFASWTSIVNARLEARKDFGIVSLALFVERADLHSWVGAVADKVTANTGGFELYIVPVERFFIALSAEYSWLNSGAQLDENHRIFGEAAGGYVIFDLPRFEATYTYAIEHFTRNHDTVAYSTKDYFNPNAYQTHGPGLVFRHPVNTWFIYGLDLHLMHAVNDSSLLLTYGAMLGFHPGERHHLELSYLRTDTVYGTTTSLYSENILRAAYTFEF